MTQSIPAAAAPMAPAPAATGLLGSRWLIVGLHMTAFAIYCAMWPLILGYRYDRHYVIDPGAIIAHAVLVLVTSFALPRRADDPRSIFLHLASAFYYLPFVAMGALEGRPFKHSVLFTLSMLAIALISRWPIRFQFRPLFNLGHIVLLSVLLGGAMVSAFIFFVGLSVFNLDISRVYEFRGESYGSLPLIVRYLQMVYLYFLAPAACVIAYHRRWWVPGLIAFALFVLVMGFSNVKFPLALLLFLFMFYAARQKPSGYIWLLLVGMIGLLTLHQTLFLDQESSLYDLLLRRGSVTRAINTFAHFDVFSQLPFMWWRDSRLSFGLFENTYGITIPYIVGEYLGYPDLAANAGWVASGFAQGGVWGVGIYSVVVGLTLAVSQSLRGTAPVMALCFGVLAGAMFSEADVTTGLLTGGVLPALVLALFTTEARIPADRSVTKRLMPWQTRSA